MKLFAFAIGATNTHCLPGQAYMKIVLMFSGYDIEKGKRVESLMLYYV